MTNVSPLWERHFGQQLVAAYTDPDLVGQAVAEVFAQAARHAIAERGDIAVMLATGNSQLGFAKAVTARDDIDWSRITILHMDEYLGMPADHPASFRLWMHRNIVDVVHPAGFEGVCGDAESVIDELARYTELVNRLQPAITVMGIGENGHLAFNDPPADFDTSDVIRLITLDERSRQQQVGEGHFASLAETPSRALTLTVPALLRSDTVLVGVPELRKAEAVRAALEGPVTPQCPASILQRRSNAHVFLDRDSASLLSRVSR